METMELQNQELLETYSYELPSELIAQEPVDPRDHAQMLVLNRQNQTMEDSVFFLLPKYLKKGDLLVRNNTKVFPARFFAQKGTGGKVEVLLMEEWEPGLWNALLKKRGKPPQEIIIHWQEDEYKIKVVGKEGHIYLLQFPDSLNMAQFLESKGYMPLPPYIKRDYKNLSSGKDRKDYQTIFAKHTGAYAAPTAGLHFTERTFQELQKKGVSIAEVTLHVGLGTFLPIQSKYIEDHKMHKEYYSIPQETLEALQTTKEKGGRILAVGTTTVRTLESYLRTQKKEGWTDLFIYPPQKIHSVDMLLTNFHLPKSTLLLLVSAFAGWPLIRKAYQHAISKKYRFYSYGDCMLIQ